MFNDVRGQSDSPQVQPGNAVQGPSPQANNIHMDSSDIGVVQVPIEPSPQADVDPNVNILNAAAIENI